MKVILHNIKSPSFKSDGRLQKWLQQLEKRGFYSKVLIIEDTNREYKESFGTSNIIGEKLFFRTWFKQRKGYLIKVPEYLTKTLNFINKEKFDVIVFHDVQQYLNILYYLVFKKRRSFKIVWDLHELPHTFLLKNRFTKQIIRFILNSVDIVVYTNEERRDFIRSNIPNVKEKKFFILNNFPDKNFILSEKNTITIPGINNDKPYFLWLGAGLAARNFDTFLKAFECFDEDFNLVILGKVEDKYKRVIEKLKSRNKVFNKFVNQEEIIKYIDNAYLSVVLYNSTSANNLYCEPNRLYQLVSRNVPVVVGNNPTMANLINKFHLGKVLDDDGKNVEELVVAIKNIINNHQLYVDNSRNIDYTSLFSWEHQVNEIIDYLQSKK